MRWKTYIASAVAVATLTACSTSPTGRSQMLLMSENDLSQMGAQAFSQYQQQLPTVGGAQLNYVQCVTNDIVAVLPPEQRDQNWQVKVFESEEANAFALPGGYVGVNTGLLEIATTQDQLASVIGHEIGHVLAHHANERASTQSATQLGMSVVGTALGANGVAGSDQIMAAMGMGAQYGVLLPFSRSHESEADTIGLQLMADAGFNPQASIELWQNMEQAGGGAPPEWMSTHPSHGSRIAGLEAGMGDAMGRYQRAQAAGRSPSCKA
ncbi:M48 family metallopeptidase [Halomonas huangheensis]|uniref:Peptidase n=1 Tax=Halomonas huangheensis TaxID=1178482 RepID=W1NA38_9GAMM|nr:M48 family metallopeptidase [Halomonas huangheensis]ALM53675.1 peptidase [Halomonas huangheensis]ERL52417.1 peptidase [Halomonas huangheensis]